MAMAQGNCLVLQYKRRDASYLTEALLSCQNASMPEVLPHRSNAADVAQYARYVASEPMGALYVCVCMLQLLNSKVIESCRF